MAEYFQPEENRLQTAQMAVSLAPSDPLPRWRLGYLLETEFPPDQIPIAVAEYEKSVALSPNDYRCWMHFGKALEQAGESDRAEKALREAVRLAPSYALPRWYLGNLLMRTDRYPEGFAELRRASEANAEFRSQLFNTAWQVHKDNFEELKTAIGNTPEMRAHFSSYLLARSRFDEGLRLWNTLSESEKREKRDVAYEIIKSLVSVKQFNRALEVWNGIAPSPLYAAQTGRIMDASFEDNIAHGKGAVFGWQVQSLSQIQMGIDPNIGHTGNRSLRMIFQVRSHLDSINVSQLVPVTPNTNYDFECYVRTERLESASMPVVAVLDATEGSYLATSAGAPSGNNNWQRIGLSFKSGPKTEAITIKVDRSPCPDSPVCPIFGTVWYDDFDLKPGK
jgi:tetratricopeptide (TPR) repeat protein